MKKIRILAGLTVITMSVSTIFTPVITVQATESIIEEEQTQSNVTVSENGYEYRTLEDDTIEIAGYKGTDTELLIPDVIDGKKVTSIGEEAFYEYDDVESITIPDSVVTIGDWAFEDCKDLISVSMPNSVVTIGNGSFAGCRKLKSIVIPNSVTSIGYNAFTECYALTDIVIPDSVTSMGDGVFFDCWNLTSVKLSSNIECLDSTFCGCNSLTNVEIPDGVTSIMGAFSDCSSLTSITIPSSVTSISPMSFDGCVNLESIKVDSKNVIYNSGDNCNAIIETATNTLVQGCGTTIIPDGVISIGEYAFVECSNLTSIAIPSSVANIGANAFARCTNLTSVTIPNGVTKINYGTFSGCSSLTSVSIPDSVTHIEESAFARCSSLENVTIPDSVTSIAECAFEKCEGLSSIIIPSSVKWVDADAFRGCTNLQEIKVDGNNEKYNSKNNCNAIIETATNTLVLGCSATVIPDDVTNIGYFAFYGCINLNQIVIPSSVVSIDDAAFYGCSNLTSVTIPNSVTSISDNAFDECSDALVVYVEEGSNVKTMLEAYGVTVKLIGENTDTQEPSVDQSNPQQSETQTPSSEQTNTQQPGTQTPSSEQTNPQQSETQTSTTEQTNTTGNQPVVGSIVSLSNGQYKIIKSDESAKEVTYVTAIGNKKKSVTIPDVISIEGNTYKVTEISDKAFKNNKKLQSVTIGKNVKKIGKEAFCNCKKLKKITIKSKVLKSVGKNAIKGINKKATIKVPKKQYTAYKKLFKNKTGYKKTMKIAK